MKNFLLLFVVFVSCVFCNSNTYLNPKFSDIIDNTSSYKIAILPLNYTDNVNKKQANILISVLKQELKEKNYTVLDLNKSNKIASKIQIKQFNSMSSYDFQNLLNTLEVDSILIGSFKLLKNEIKSSIKIYGKNKEVFWYSLSQKSLIDESSLNKIDETIKSLAQNTFSTLLPISGQLDIIDDGMDDLFQQAITLQK